MSESTVPDAGGRPVHKLYAILRGDIANSSSLGNVALFSAIWRELEGQLSDLSAPWLQFGGEDVKAFFYDPLQAVQCAFRIHAYLAEPRWPQNFPRLLARVALHLGPFVVPEQEGGEPAGTEHVQPARLEPVITPGETWATDAFASVAANHEWTGVVLEHLGRRKLHKGGGVAEVWRVRPAGGRPQAMPAGDPVGLAQELLKHGDDAQRLAALEALGRIPGGRAANLLLGAVKRKDQHLRRKALLVLQERRDPTTAAKLLELVERTAKPYEPRALLVQVLGEVGAPDNTAVAAKLCILAEDPDEAIKVKAIFGARRFLHGTVNARINRALDEGSSAVKQAACLAASERPTDPDLGKRLVEIAWEDDQSTELRAGALEALLAGGHLVVTIADKLEGLATDEEQPAELRGVALACLASLGTTRSQMTVAEVAARSSDPVSPHAITLLPELLLPNLALLRPARRPENVTYLEVFRRRLTETA